MWAKNNAELEERTREVGAAIPSRLKDSANISTYPEKSEILRVCKNRENICMILTQSKLKLTAREVAEIKYLGVRLDHKNSLEYWFAEICVPIFLVYRAPRNAAEKFSSLDVVNPPVDFRERFIKYTFLAHIDLRLLSTCTLSIVYYSY